MIDYKQLDLVYDLVEKYEKNSGNHAHVSMKLGLHPRACEFKLRLELAPSDEDIYIFETIDELIDFLKCLIGRYKQNARFKVGQVVLFLDVYQEIISFEIDKISFCDKYKEHIYWNHGWFSEESKIYASKKELIEAQVEKWQQMLREEK